MCGKWSCFWRRGGDDDDGDSSGDDVIGERGKNPKNLFGLFGVVVVSDGSGWSGADRLFVVVVVAVELDTSESGGVDLKEFFVIPTTNRFFLKNGPNPPSFCLFLLFSQDKYSINVTINYKGVDGMLGTRTQGSKMIGADESTKLWRHPNSIFLLLII